MDESNACANIIMTFAEVMAFLKISRPTLTELLKRGEIPARKLGNQWRFCRQTIIDYVSGKDHVSRSRRKR
jgi:excisionase family DNA binding protein